MTDHIYIALGSNLPATGFETPAETLEAALQVLEEEGVPVVRCSSVWQTAPVPVSDQPWYANAVIETETDLGPAALMTKLHEIEQRFERVRTVANAARTLDLDLLDHAGEASSGEGSWPVLPHPRMHERAFVLFPLKEIAPDWRHPRSDIHIDELIGSMPGEQDARRD